MLGIIILLHAWRSVDFTVAQVYCSARRNGGEMWRVRFINATSLQVTRRIKTYDNDNKNKKQQPQWR
jgi:hypothetical protein